MEEPNSTDSLVLAATNHVEILDEALARRFDEVVEYTLPDAASARGILERRLGKFKFASKVWPGIESALEGLSRSEEHTSELQSLMRISYAVFCLKKKNMKITSLRRDY